MPFVVGALCAISTSHRPTDTSVAVQRIPPPPFFFTEVEDKANVRHPKKNPQITMHYTVLWSV
jgi:hypothetical protein